MVTVFFYAAGPRPLRRKGEDHVEIEQMIRSSVCISALPYEIPVKGEQGEFYRRFSSDGNDIRAEPDSSKDGGVGG